MFFFQYIIGTLKQSGHIPFRILTSSGTTLQLHSDFIQHFPNFLQPDLVLIVHIYLSIYLWNHKFIKTSISCNMYILNNWFWLCLCHYEALGPWTSSALTKLDQTVLFKSLVLSWNLVPQWLLMDTQKCHELRNFILRSKQSTALKHFNTVMTITQS